jgi:uncharacterized RDD family membrane protein YckC
MGCVYRWVADRKMQTSENNDKTKRAERQAVCFDRKDYAGLFRRLIIVCVDSAALVAIALALVVAAEYAWFALHPDADDLPPGLIVLLPVTAFVYLTVVKRSRIGSLGYLLTGVRIVDVEGQRPSLLRMTARFFWTLPLPWALFVDFGWLLDEPAKQTLRDKWAGTFVVRKKAKPIGRVPIRYERICLIGIHLIVPEPDFTRGHEPADETAAPDAQD